MMAGYFNYFNIVRPPLCFRFLVWLQYDFGHFFVRILDLFKFRRTIWNYFRIFFSRYFHHRTTICQNLLQSQQFEIPPSWQVQVRSPPAFFPTSIQVCIPIGRYLFKIILVLVHRRRKWVENVSHKIFFTEFPFDNPKSFQPGRMLRCSLPSPIKKRVSKEGERAFGMLATQTRQRKQGALLIQHLKSQSKRKRIA